MGKLLGFITFFLILASCTPQEAKKNAQCASQEIFDEVSRTCVADSSPRLPIASTTKITITENDPETTFSINYTDGDGDAAQSCTITSSQTGLRGMYESQGILYKVDTSLLTGPLFTLTLQNDVSITPGFEVASLSGFDITVRMRDGISTSQNVAAAINSALAGTVSATVTQNFVFQNVESASQFQAGTCTCLNGACSMTVEPVTNFDGTTRINYFLSDNDGNGDTKTLEVVVANLDAAPTVSGVTGVGLTEDTSSLITLAYSDVDGDLATSCSISNLDTNLTLTSACSCSSGVCRVGVQGLTNYNNASTFTFFDYTVTANGQTSSTASVTGTVAAVNDIPSTVDFNVVATEEGTNDASYTVAVTLPTITDIETASSSIRYRIQGATPVDGTNFISITGCLDTTTSTACTFTFEGEWNPSPFTFYYQVSDDGGATWYPSSGLGGAITVIITSVNDVPELSAGTYAESGNESNTWSPSAITFSGSLPSGTDNDSSLTYFLSDASGNVITDGTGTNGVLSGCLNLNGSNSTSGCVYTPTNGNFTGLADTYYYVAYDGANYSNAKAFTITVNPVSDVPILCKYTRYDLDDGKTECGVKGCVGDGEPLFSPTSHSTAEPVVYYDETNGNCYQSVSTSGWTNVASSLGTFTIGEKETLLINNIIPNEGGDSTEDAETFYVDTTSISITNTILVNRDKMTFTYTNASGTSDSFDGTAPGAINSFTSESGAMDDGILSLSIVPTAGQVGTSDISFNICDDATCSGNVTAVSFSIEVKAQSIIHNGWAKIKSVGIKTNKFSQALETNNACSYSLDMCDGGSVCKSSATGTPTASADHAGAIYRMGDGSCFYATAKGSSNWVSFAPFCNISTVSKKDANTEVSCTYSTNLCDTGSACTSAVAGTPTASADAAGAVFRDGNGACYIASAAGTGNWVQQTYLSDETNTCDTDLEYASCIGDDTPAVKGLAAASNEGVFYYNSKSTALDSQRCWYSDGATWNTYSSTTQIDFTWNAFTVSGTGSISGYNIFRRKAGESFDYQNPINIDTVASTATSYSDNGTNSRVAPSPNIVYFYEVRPILTLPDSSTLEVSTNAAIKNVRIMSPPDNMIFAHRWMVNKTICDLMGSSTYQDYNYICAYIGPEDTDSTAGDYSTFNASTGISTVYDIGADLLVNRFEQGCPYSSSGCSTTDGSCIGNVAPSAAEGSNGDIYYDRSSATCSVKTAGVWTAISNEDLAISQVAHLPPLVNISAANATNFCTAQTKPSTIDGIISGGTLTNGYELPSRKDQVVYSQWEITSSFNDGNAQDTELGTNLNSSSKCNTASANGIDFGYTDNALPDSTTFYSLPGTASSSIRSVYTGSTQTEDCSSIFGVQDSIGNVAEWTSTTITYDGASGSPDSFSSTNFNTSNDASSYFWANNFTFDNITGPCFDDTDVDTNCDDGSMASWLIEDTVTYNAGDFLVTIGMPVSSQFRSVQTSDSSLPFVLDIGSTGGIPSDKLHDDTIETNMTTFNTDGAGTVGRIATGGGYSTGTGSGTYSMEFLNQSTVTRDDVGLRCLIRVPYSDYVE